MKSQNVLQKNVEIPCPKVNLSGTMSFPENCCSGFVLFAHGSGSSRLSPRNRYVAGRLHAAGSGTLLFDLLTQEEEKAESVTRHLRFDVHMLAERLVQATRWAMHLVPNVPFGYFGASTGAAAALIAAAALGKEKISAVVSRGGRPDLAGAALGKVETPTLLIVGGFDTAVIEMNKAAMRAMPTGVAELTIVPGASHLFEEPGTLAKAASLATDWFDRHFSAEPHQRAG